MTIREYLRDVLSFSRRLIVSIKFDGGSILVNGNPKTVRYLLATGDQLVIQFPPEKKGFYMHAENIPLSIVYEDDDILVLNKQAGIATTPSPLQPSGTIANGLLAYYEAQDIPYTVHIVTRLDRDTSGLLLVAKHRYSHSLLARDQQKGLIKRKYAAIVPAKLINKQGVIDAPIGRKEGSIIEREVTDRGKEARTYYRVKKESIDYSLLELELETGRTHQIRVHLSHLGHPIVGDSLYGKATNQMKRQALHCVELQFNHPITQLPLSFVLAIPQDMKKLI